MATGYWFSPWSQNEINREANTIKGQTTFDILKKTDKSHFFCSNVCVYQKKWNVLRHTTLKGNPSKVRSHIRANNMPFGYKIQIHLIFFLQKTCVFQIFVVPL